MVTASEGQKQHPSDADLVEKYRKGDLSAMEILVNRHGSPLMGYIVNMTGNRQKADDVFQEVWVRAISKLSTYKQDNFPGWLMRIARNFVIDESRKKRPELSLDYETDEGFSMQQTISDNAPSPDRRVASEELGQRIAAAVDELPAEQKEVFILRVKSDMPFKEICKIQGTSINTALARMQYAMTHLRKLLKDEYAQLEGAI